MGYDAPATGIHHMTAARREPHEQAANGFQTVQAPRLHERVVHQLVQQIVGGAFGAGATLPTEPDLAQQFGVSRTVVREAVRMLVSKGLVAVRQGSGMWVQPPDRWDHLDPLVIFEQVKARGDEALLDELIETRRVLETEIAALAALRRTAEDVQALEVALERMEAAREDAASYTRHDLVFHEAVLAAARNRLLREALRPVAAAMQAGRFIAVRRAEVISRSLPSHHEIFQAILDGDAARAREAMRRHILMFEQDIRAGLRASDGD